MSHKLRDTFRGITYIAVFAVLLGSASGLVQLFASGANAQQNRSAQRPDVPAAAVTHWAFVRQDGKLLASSSGGRASLIASPHPTLYQVSWGGALPASCVPMVTEAFNRGPGEPVGDAGPAGVQRYSGGFWVRTYAPGGNDHREPFYIAVFCP